MQTSGEPTAPRPHRLVRHAREQVLRVVQLRNEIDLLLPVGVLGIQTLQVAQRRKVAECESDGIEYRNFTIIQTAGSIVLQDLSKFAHWQLAVELLNLAFDASLRFELDHDACEFGTKNIH